MMEKIVTFYGPIAVGAGFEPALAVSIITGSIQDGSMIMD